MSKGVPIVKTGKFSKGFLIFILFLAVVLRFHNLGGPLPGFNQDEATNGYDAYSILKTGRDRHGLFMPVAVHAFGKPKSPLYTYLAVPSVAVFGLNEFAERFPAAFMGVLTVYLTYLLCRKLFERDGEAVGLIAALFLAVSPWHTHINRFGHDVNTMPFFFVLDYTRS